MRPSKKLNFYVYTPLDGNEDGMHSGMTFSEAKKRAKTVVNNLRADGINTSALVNRRDDCVTVWSFGGSDNN